MSLFRRKPAPTAEAEREAFAAFTAALRASGVSHYDGSVPGWASERPVKLILSAEPAPVAAPAEKPRTGPKPFTLKKRSLEEIEAAALGHVRLHGGG